MASRSWTCVNRLGSTTCTYSEKPVNYLQGNHLGATVQATDASRNVVWKIDYDAFGRASGTGAQDFRLRLPGQVQDNPYLYYNGYRFYDPDTGRYIQPEPLYQDPEAILEFVADGMVMNPYAYAANKGP